MQVEENETQLILYPSEQPRAGRWICAMVISFVICMLKTIGLKSRGDSSWPYLLALACGWLFIAVLWRLEYCAGKSRLVFDRKDKALYGISPVFWSNKKCHVSLPLDLSLFDGIQTYILQQPYISTEKYGNPDWDMCVLELVTPEPVRGVVFYRLPPIVKKLGTSKKERLENPEAALLAQRLASFLGIKNYGFLGEKQRTALWYLHAKEKSTIERMFF